MPRYDPFDAGHSPDQPESQAIATDDLGTTYSTPTMQYQAAFDNERRWLGWDLICGRVRAGHPLRLFLLSSGISIRDLDWLCEFACHLT